MKRLNTRAIASTAAAVLGLATGALPGFAQTAKPQAISLYNLGLTAYKQGSPESAIIFFKRACDIDPDLADAQYNLGVIYQSEKRLNEAVPRFQEVLRIKPSDPDVHYQLGLCFIDLGKLADARQSLAGIPPNDKHFGDAQKRISMIDAQAAQGVPMQPMNAPPPTIISTPPSQPYVAQPVTPPVQPLMEQLPPPPPPPAQVQQPPQQPLNPGNFSKPYAAAATGPVPILANSTVRVIATGFNAPAGLSFDRYGNLYIANFNSNTVDRISPDGTKTLFSSGSNLKGPIGVTVDGSGNVYVANYMGGTVVRINPAGVSTVIAASFRKPYYLTMDKDGNLYVSQQEDNSIVRVTLPRPIGAKP